MNKLTKLTGWTVVAVVISFIYNINSIGVDSVINEQTGCQPTCQTQHIESNHKTSPLQAANPLENSGPLEIANPLQSTGPLQNLGPGAASPFENGPMFNSDLNISSEFNNIIMPSIELSNIGFSAVDGTWTFAPLGSINQLQLILESPENLTPALLTVMVNKLVSDSIPLGETPITTLPQVIYNPTNPSYASPN